MFLPTDIYGSEVLGAYGLSFSPNNQLLYVNEGIEIPGVETIRRLYQYNLQTGSTTTIQASKTLVGVPDFVNNYYTDMQLAPNGIIYVAITI